MNWLTEGGIRFSHTDLITREVWRHLYADKTLQDIMTAGILRYHVWAPDENAGSNGPRTIVASLYRTEDGRMSRRVKGKHTLLVAAEFRAAVTGLADEDPGIDSLLWHYQRILNNAGLLEFRPGIRLCRSGPTYETITSNPKAITLDNPTPGGPTAIVCYHAGLEVSYEYKETYPDLDAVEEE